MNLIAVVDRRWGIGKDGDQLVYIPADLRRFKALTTGHPVILGRKTLATFPGGRPLPGRRNLILSHSVDFSPPGGEVFHDLESLLCAAPTDSFVIGGGSVYEALLPFCDRAYLTVVEHTYPADTYFPNLSKRLSWRVTEEERGGEHEGISYRYLSYKRISSLLEEVL